MKKFITLVAEAEKKKDVKLIKESNVLKHSSDEKVYYPSSRSREEKGREWKGVEFRKRTWSWLKNQTFCAQ